MSVDERTRHELHGRFEELLGPELASAFMSYLPPVGWADVATKRDLDALRTEIQLDLAREISGVRSDLAREISGVRSEMHSQFRSTIFAMLGANATLAGLAFAAARIG